MKDIIDILTKSQKGYDEKIPDNAPTLMSEIFSARQDLLTLGTGSTELCLGRDAVMELIRGDWNGGWGDFKIDIGNAKIESGGDAAWFYADCTVKYSFEDTEDKIKDWIGIIKKTAEYKDGTPKQNLSILNWMLGLRFHSHGSEKREYLWPSEFSGMMVKEDGAWKITTLHFAMAKSNYPDERFEESVYDGAYRAYHTHAKGIIVKHEANKADYNVLQLLKNLENEMANDTEFGSLYFDSEQVLAFDAGNFAWIAAIGTTKQTISEDEIFNRSIKEIEGLLDSDLPPQEQLLQVKRSIAYALKESAYGSEFTWPIRFTAVIEKTGNGYKFRHKHFSYPFQWIIEGKL